MSQRTLEQCSLWRLAAFFCVTGTDLSEIARFVLPVALRRFRTLSESLLSRGRPEALKKVLQLTGPGSEFETAVLHPTSYTNFEDAFDETLPLDVVSALREAWNLDAATSASTPLSAQYLMEGLDVWLQQRDPAENDRFVFACGVSPAALTQGKAIHPLAAHDFVFDVIFPEGSAVWPHAALAPSGAAAVTPAKQVSDWLVGVLRVNFASSMPPPCTEWIPRPAHPAQVLEVCDKKRTTTTATATATAAAASSEPEAACPVPPLAPATVVVEPSPAPVAPPAAAAAAAVATVDSPCASSPARCPPKKGTNSTRPNRTAQCNERGGGGDNESAPEEEELLLTEDNLDHLMSTSPQSVPKPILQARRKPLTHPNITAFELEQHYTVPELREVVQTMVRNYRNAPAFGDKELAASVETIELVAWRGKKQNIVASLVDVLPHLRRLQHAVLKQVTAVDVDALSSSESRTGSVARGIVLSEHGGREAATHDLSVSSRGASESCTAQIAELLSQAATGSVAPKSLVRELAEQFTRSQLDEYLRSVGNASQSDIASLRTKSDCAKRILSVVTASRI